MTIKEKIRQLELGSGSGCTIDSDVSTAVGEGPSGTFARPIRLKDFFVQRKVEFKGWVTDYKQCSYQGLTETEVSNFIRDLIKFQKYLDWDLTKTEQGTWPTKTCVSNVVLQGNQLADDGRVAGHHQRRTKEGALRVAWARNLIQTGDEPEKEAIGEGPCSVL